jgi:2-oxoglutarate/2-oxoacid ferredoxin oxidoreductase subunit alpha
LSTFDFANSINWVIGGAQGSGVDSAANVFSNTCAHAGFYLYGKREFYSNIKGEHSYFSMRISEDQVHSQVDDIDLLVSFDAETIFRHSDRLIEGGAIIYDSSITNITLDEVPTIDSQAYTKISRYLSDSNNALTIQGVLNYLKSKGCKLFGLPYFEMVSELSKRINEPGLSKLSRTINIIAISASLALLNFDKNQVFDGIKNIFAAKPKIISINVAAADYTYYFIDKNFRELKLRSQIPNRDKLINHILILGSQAAAIGKIAAGCRFQTYYPITPASDDSEFLEANQIFDLAGGTKGSILVVQTEDEIAAITMAIGGALTGVRSATATSGPGFSLMAEALGWAGMNEVPLVVTMYQRAGPSTGLPTRHEQSDLLFAINAGHGEFPKIVYASGDIEESFYDSLRVFNYAEKFQLPVIHMLDKYIASSIMTINNFDSSRVSIDRGKFVNEVGVDSPNLGIAKNYLRFKFEDDHISTRVSLGTKNAIFWNTGDEHTEEGHISEDPDLRIKMMEKRMGKLDTVLNQIDESDKLVCYDFPNSDGKYVVISWGSTKGPILDALSKLSKEGHSMKFIQLKLLHPFPAATLEKYLNDSSIIIDIEMNFSSQLGKLISQHNLKKSEHLIVKYNGRPMSSNELYSSLSEILRGKGKSREVLTNGA